jgi:hypothetical protein
MLLAARWNKFPSLIDATIYMIKEGLDSEAFTSVQLVQVCLLTSLFVSQFVFGSL